MRLQAEICSQQKMHPSVATERYETLDSLRGIAALIVVFSHCGMVFPVLSDYGLHFRLSADGWAEPFGWLLTATPLQVVWLGRGPVVLFFVLSGFVLALPWLRGRPPAYGGYAIRRVCRIYLPYLAAVALAMGLEEAFAGHHLAGQSEWFDRMNWTERVGVDAIIAHLLMLGTHNSFDNVIWSLVYEMRSSLLLPLLLLPVLRWRLTGAVGLVVVLILVARVLGKMGVDSPIVHSIAGTLRYASLFVMGAAAAQAAGWITGVLGRHAAHPWLLLVVGLSLLSMRWLYLELYVQGLGGVLVIAAVLAPGPIARLLTHPAPRGLGRISYSLYLIHVPVLLTLMHVFAESLPRLAIVAAVPPLAILAAIGFHRWVEDPAAQLGRRLGRRMDLGPA